MERHCKKCGFFATNASEAADAACPRCGAAYPKLDAAAMRVASPAPRSYAVDAAAGTHRALGAATRGEDSRWVAMRRATPSNVALPRTLEWSRKLPADVQPHALVRTFGRIANQLAADWEETDLTYAYFDQLLIDRRGNRRGFPPDVQSELEALRRSYVVTRPRRDAALASRVGVWGDVRKR